jgi:hypothetical protein
MSPVETAHKIRIAAVGRVNPTSKRQAIVAANAIHETRLIVRTLVHMPPGGALSQELFALELSFWKEADRLAKAKR